MKKVRLGLGPWHGWLSPLHPCSVW